MRSKVARRDRTENLAARCKVAQAFHGNSSGVPLIIFQLCRSIGLVDPGARDQPDSFKIASTSSCWSFAVFHHLTK